MMFFFFLLINNRVLFSLCKKTFPVNPGYVTYTYETISTDFFGLKNIGVPSFGALNGRSSCIQTAYFDGSLWVEAGNSGEYFNVYVCIE